MEDYSHEDNQELRCIVTQGINDSEERINHITAIFDQATQEANKCGNAGTIMRVFRGEINTVIGILLDERTNSLTRITYFQNSATLEIDSVWNDTQTLFFVVGDQLVSADAFD